MSDQSVLQLHQHSTAFSHGKVETKINGTVQQKLRRCQKSALSFGHVCRAIKLVNVDLPGFMIMIMNCNITLCAHRHEEVSLCTVKMLGNKKNWLIHATQSLFLQLFSPSKCKHFSHVEQ